VRPAPDKNGYQLVAGERRWRAAQIAGLHEIPAIIRSLTDAQTLEIALVENIQRADLNAIEEARAYQKLCGDFGHTQEQLATLVGKSRSHITNLLRLLGLPQSIQDALVAGKISMGHARALINSPDAGALLGKIISGGLSVRVAEALVRKSLAIGADNDAKSGIEIKTQARDGGSVDPDIMALESHLGDLLGLKLSIAHNDKGSGILTLNYTTLDQLDWLCQRLSGEKI
jgi:ParB family transcriptional regulator, chromosome partitioning protein